MSGCCASWPVRWARTFRRRSLPGAGWPRAPVRCWRRCRIRTAPWACSCCHWLPSSRPRRCTRRPTVSASARAGRELEELGAQLRAALELGAPLPAATELLHNDLQRAAVSLCPQIAGALGEAREAGAADALVSGSGPTVVGLFPRANALGRVERAAAQLAGRVPAPVAAISVDAGFARAVGVARPGPDAAHA